MTATVSINVVIKDCSECTKFSSERYYTEDSFEMIFDQRCGASGGRRIKLHEATERQVAIPNWCPLRSEK